MYSPINAVLKQQGQNIQGWKGNHDLSAPWFFLFQVFSKEGIFLNMLEFSSHPYICLGTGTPDTAVSFIKVLKTEVPWVPLKFWGGQKLWEQTTQECRGRILLD